MAPLGIHNIRRTHESKQRTHRLRLGRRGAQTCRESGDDFATGRHRPEHDYARQVHQFAELLEAELNLATGHQLAHRHTGGRLQDAVADGVGDAPALEHSFQRYTARPSGIADCCARTTQRAAAHLLNRCPAAGCLHIPLSPHPSEPDRSCCLQPHVRKRPICRSHRRRAPPSRTAHRPVPVWPHPHPPLTRSLPRRRCAADMRRPARPAPRASPSTKYR